MARISSKSKTKSSELSEPSTPPPVKVPKKRGRKPKGGRIIEDNTTVITNTKPEFLPNIILHLKVTDNNTPNLSTQYKPYDIDDNQSGLGYSNYNVNMHNIYNMSNNNLSDKEQTELNDFSIINNKLNELKQSFYFNNSYNSKSACFWCTCDFSNPQIFIPSSKINNEYEVYGCFCTPQCATAFLFNQQLDSSVKWEQYALLNSLYSHIYNYKTNILPAPAPFYVLDKYYGNLTIEEYRKLILNNNDTIITTNKPFKRYLPELIDKIGDIPSNIRVKLS